MWLKPLKGKKKCVGPVGLWPWLGRSVAGPIRVIKLHTIFLFVKKEPFPSCVRSGPLKKRVKIKKKGTVSVLLVPSKCQNINGADWSRFTVQVLERFSSI
jgi:hypothetical protein